MADYLKIPVSLMRSENFRALRRKDNRVILHWWLSCALSAAGYGQYGVLPPIRKLANDIGVSVFEAEIILQELEHSQLIERVDGEWLISDWEDSAEPILGGASASAASSNNSIRRSRITAARQKGTHTESEWIAMVQFCGGKCVSCGSTGPLEKDHVTPVSIGGSDSIDNIQPLCKSCNSSKRQCLHDYRPIGWLDYLVMTVSPQGVK